MEQVITRDGGTLWAQRAGAGSPIVLLHAAGTDSRLWDDVFSPLVLACSTIWIRGGNPGRPLTIGSRS